MSAAAPWFSEALLRVEERLAAIEPPLATRIAKILAHLSRRNGGQSLETAFTSPAAVPYPRLTDAYRHDLGLLPEDPRLVSIGEAAILLYLHVRIQDDMIDDPVTWDPGYTLAAEAFSAASVRAFSAALSFDARFYAFREATMIAFLTAATWELDVYRKGGGTGCDIARLGRKLLPMAIPLGALAIVAERPGDLDPLTAFAEAIGGGLQVVNDLLNIAEDHAAGRTTPVLRWLYAGGRAIAGQPRVPIRAIFLSDPALDRALATSRAQIARATEIAEALGASTLASAARESAALVEAAPVRLLGLSLHAGAV
jgi:hypothetical protein